MNLLAIPFSILITLVIPAGITKYTTECENFVPDEGTAIKVAEAIWHPIYGEAINNSRPFIAQLVDGDVWQVKGTLNAQKGGIPYIEIKKCDCRVLKVSHSK